uniref:Uncharacterized protein n=1 Tax=Hyaloperonospora arabidopsidis (strain Emoy2) TaxID=559515 RepID=M4BY43_HYAAE
MTISRNVYNQLFEQAPDASDGSKEKVIRLRPTEAKAGAVVMSAKSKIQMWTKDEHERFLAALEKFPAGPWKKVADFIGTKTPRQTMTHAQKYRQKIHRRQRGLRNQKKSSEGSAALNGSSTSSCSTSLNSSNTESPAVLDKETTLKEEPKDLIVSPYGVAELQLKPGSEAAPAAAAGATNDQLLNILAQQATTIHDKPELMEMDEAEAITADDAAVKPDAAVVAEATATTADDSMNNNLPSLAEILHLSGGEGQTAAAGETEVAPPVSEAKTEAKLKVEATKIEPGPQDVPEECKCNCKCSVHGGRKVVVEATATQPRSEDT